MIRFRDTRHLVFILGCALALACEDDADDIKGLGDQIEPTFQSGLPFVEPEEIVSRDGVLRGKLVSAPTVLDVSGASVRGESFNGTFVGPTLRLEPGDTIELGLENGLEQHTNIHYHGFHVDPGGKSDNIFRMVPPGEPADYVVEVPESHDQGVFWYHSHAHMMSESQVFQGLSGMVLIGDTRRLLPERFHDVKTRMLALKDLQVKDGAIVAVGIDSNAKTVRTVNALVDPMLTVAPGSTELWYIANIGADIFYDIAMDGVSFRVIGEDGNPQFQTYEASHLVMPPGKRWEVLVTFDEAKNLEFKTLAYDQQGDHYPETRLMQVNVDGDEVEPIAALTDAENPGKEDDLLARPVAENRTWTFSEDEETSQFKINGKEFDPNRIDVSPKLGTAKNGRYATSPANSIHSTSTSTIFVSSA
ncbi:multicopper oxidase family protein [Sorangium sp. So ce388]|uniref:multicopper oxidase family protein n=1 Tax=Sorangium sp. So ce388 TaxID=3133309 RepID=UPI003F5C1B90